MKNLFNKLASFNNSGAQPKEIVLTDVRKAIDAAGYTVIDEWLDKPWGAFWRFDNAQAQTFIAEFFPGLTMEEAGQGVPHAELSPKILLVAPHQRLSWQYHHRRAERWRFLTDGAGYFKSASDDMGDVHAAKKGDVVQFACGERHRLASLGAGYALVAEIWQHSDPENPSDEDDIVRVADDYSR